MGNENNTSRENVLAHIIGQNGLICPKCGFRAKQKDMSTCGSCHATGC